MFNQYAICAKFYFTFHRLYLEANICVEDVRWVLLSNSNPKLRGDPQIPLDDSQGLVTIVITVASIVIFRLDATNSGRSLHVGSHRSCHIFCLGLSLIIDNDGILNLFSFL